MKNKMFCPYCHSLLINGKKRAFETLSDHIGCRENIPLRSTLICSNNNCPTTKEDLFWDKSGDFYGWNENFKFVNDINSAYPSISRKLDIEIYKKGLKKEIYLPAILMLGILKPLIEFNYTADEYGTVLTKSWKLKWLKRDCWYKPDRFGYHTYYTFPIVIIINNIKHDKRVLNNIENIGINEYTIKTIKEIFEPIASWDKRWWRHFGLWLNKIIFFKYYKLIK